jgi:putative addiction module component (TIGR02574 family)
MILETLPEVSRLSPEEKLILVGELWDELARNPSDVPVSREQLAELDRRMEEFRQNPSDVRSWEEIKRRLATSRVPGGH